MNINCFHTWCLMYELLTRLFDLFTRMVVETRQAGSRVRCMTQHEITVCVKMHCYCITLLLTLSNVLTHFLLGNVGAHAHCQMSLFVLIMTNLCLQGTCQVVRVREYRD